MAGVRCPVSARPAAKIKGKYGVQPEDPLGRLATRLEVVVLSAHITQGDGEVPDPYLKFGAPSAAASQPASERRDEGRPLFQDSCRQRS
eukprot:COSAG01_NODE_17156_length_1173_cov_7.779330_2_plen_89_part_00